ncbi:hypothetical protein AAFF_G00103710 [Aldrovandia affinis]|uniref:RGS domain-containing protein n=1 Tax=Aldrovandia affinis TaxID=143900 RepID=A0AAD7RU43_9TELE|nr:hypothetical protein AAFF_G00103710 [Aldrovandia affinis]
MTDTWKDWTGYCTLLYVYNNHNMDTVMAVRPQKPDKSATKNKNRKRMTATEAKRGDVAKAQKWTESLGMLVNNEAGLTAFATFLKSEYSQENIEFWVACEDYKSIASQRKLATKAKEIYSVYVEVESPKQVNLDSATREETRRNMADISLSCFEEAQRKIFLLMEKDSYRRFLKSRLFLDLLRGRRATRGAEGKRGRNVDA